MEQNTLSIWSDQRYHYRYNAVLQKHKRLSDGNTNFFDRSAGVLQRMTLVLLFILCLDYVLQKSIDLIKDGFSLKKQEADTDDLALLANTPALGEPLQKNLEQAARRTGLSVNVN